MLKHQQLPELLIASAIIFLAEAEAKAPRAPDNMALLVIIIKDFISSFLPLGEWFHPQQKFLCRYMVLASYTIEF
jgi:hypothetical protein